MDRKSIKCQAEHKSGKGCYTCGGYKTIMVSMTCGCGRKYWVRPGAWTWYEGKEYTSVDGLKITCHTDGDKCRYCEGALVCRTLKKIKE